MHFQHDGDVGSVEQSDWVQSVWTSLSGRFHWQLDSETLQVHNSENTNKVANNWNMFGKFGL